MNYQVRSIDYQDCKEWFLKKHYAHRIPSVSFCFGLYSDKLEGVCSFGKPPSPSLCESICGFEYKDIVFELNRLVINEGIQKNALSFFVSQCLKMLPELIVVSFADAEQGHHGYIYQATNWIYTGVSNNVTTLKNKDGQELHFRSLGHKRQDNSMNCKLVKLRTNEKEINKQDIANYLKSYKGNFTAKQIDLEFGYKDTASHWFRLDKGFSLPKVDDWFKLKSILNFDDKYDNLMNQFILVPDRSEQIKKLGFEQVKIKPKHRYIYFIGSKKQKQKLRKALRYEIQPYPKGDNKRYDASYQPTTQIKLF